MCCARLLAAAVPTRGVAGAGSHMAHGASESAATGQAVGHCEIPRLGRFAVEHSEVRTRPLTLRGVRRLPPIATSDPTPVLGEHGRGSGGEKKYCGAERFDLRHLSFSCLGQALVAPEGSPTRF